MSELKGHQLDILKLLCEKSCPNPPYITSKIDTNTIANILDIDQNVVKTSIKRLINKEYLSKQESKSGRSGWIKYSIPETSFNCVRNSNPILYNTENRLNHLEEDVKILKEENLTLKKENLKLKENYQMLNEDNKKRKIEYLDIKEDNDKTKKKVKNLESDKKHRDKYFGGNLPLSLLQDVKVNHLNWDKTEEPIYAFKEGPFESFKLHCIEIIDYHLNEKNIEGFKIGITNNSMTRLKRGYGMCRYLVVIYRSDHWDKVGEMENQLVKYYKDHPKLRNKAPGKEGRQAEDKGPFYTYVVFS